MAARDPLQSDGREEAAPFRFLVIAAVVLIVVAVVLAIIASLNGEAAAATEAHGPGASYRAAGLVAPVTFRAAGRVEPDP